MTQFPNGGPQMIAMVRDLLASDPATLKAIIGLLSSANPDQSVAMGTAGGQVALMAVSVDPGFATDLQDAFASSKNSSASVAFSAVVGGDIKLTAATGGVGGGGGGGPTGQNGSFGGFFAGTSVNFPTAHGNTPDTFHDFMLWWEYAGRPRKSLALKSSASSCHTGPAGDVAFNRPARAGVVLLCSEGGLC